MFRSSIAAIAVAATTLTAVPATAQDDELESLRFGIISTESQQNLRQVWEPFLEDMEAHLGMEVEAFFAPDYAGVIEAMRFDKVDVAWFGNKSAMEAVDRAGGEIFAQTVDVSGNPGYWSHLIVHQSSDLESMEDVLENAGELTLGNGDPNSTSGFLVPGYYVFARNGVDPRQDFKRMVTANHETNAMAVANQQVDVATNNSESLARLAETQPEKRKQIKVIWESPLIPSDPLVWRKNLPQEAKEKIGYFIYSYGVVGDEIEAERQVLADLAWAPFEPSNNDQLLPIRQLELFRDRSRIQTDEDLSDAEKEEQLAEIDRQLEELNKRMEQLEG